MRASIVYVVSEAPPSILKVVKMYVYKIYETFYISLFPEDLESLSRHSSSKIELGLRMGTLAMVGGLHEFHGRHWIA